MELRFSKIDTNCGAPLWHLYLPNAKSVATAIFVHTGTRDENWPKEAGIAHALEHMHFQGTKNFKNSLEVAEYIEEVGGDLNAFTNCERTYYFARVPTQYAERAFYILAEQLNNSIFPDEKIPVEMKNIVQELKRRNDNPQRFLDVNSYRFFYQSHPLSKDVVGLEDSILNFKKEDFLKFKEKFYKPANYEFIVVGNIAERESLNLINKYFLASNGSKNNRDFQEIEPLISKKRIINKDVQQVHISLAAAIGPSKEKDAVSLGFFAAMISGGQSFPLFQEVRVKRGLCYNVSAFAARWSDVGRFDVYIGTDPQRHKEAISAIFEVIEKSKKDENLLNKVKKLKLGELDLSFENTEDIIKMTASDILFKGQPRDYSQVKKEIEEISIKDIEKAVDKYLKPDLFLTTMLGPKNFKGD